MRCGSFLLSGWAPCALLLGALLHIEHCGGISLRAAEAATRRTAARANSRFVEPAVLSLAEEDVSGADSEQKALQSVARTEVANDASLTLLGLGEAAAELDEELATVDDYDEEDDDDDDDEDYDILSKVAEAASSVAETVSKGAQAVAHMLPHIQSGKQLMSKINLLRTKMCWKRHNLPEHEPCLKFLGIVCEKQSTGEGICKKFTKLVENNCEKLVLDPEHADPGLKKVHCETAHKLNPDFEEPDPDQDEYEEEKEEEEAKAEAAAKAKEEQKEKEEEAAEEAAKKKAEEKAEKEKAEKEKKDQEKKHAKKNGTKNESDSDYDEDNQVMPSITETIDGLTGVGNGSSETDADKKKDAEEKDGSAEEGSKDKKSKEANKSSEDGNSWFKTPQMPAADDSRKEEAKSPDGVKSKEKPEKPKAKKDGEAAADKSDEEAEDDQVMPSISEAVDGLTGGGSGVDTSGDAAKKDSKDGKKAASDKDKKNEKKDSDKKKDGDKGEEEDDKAKAKANEKKKSSEEADKDAKEDDHESEPNAKEDAKSKKKEGAAEDGDDAAAKTGKASSEKKKGDESTEDAEKSKDDSEDSDGGGWVGDAMKAVSETFSGGDEEKDEKASKEDKKASKEKKDKKADEEDETDDTDKADEAAKGKDAAAKTKKKADEKKRTSPKASKSAKAAEDGEAEEEEEEAAGGRVSTRGSYGLRCKDDGTEGSTCGRHGKEYDWCYTKADDKEDTIAVPLPFQQNWDYCVRRKDTSHGYSCRNDGSAASTCGKHDGTSYQWCYTKAGNWDYCATHFGEKKAPSKPKAAKKAQAEPKVDNTDSDGDGVPDFKDAFPADPKEWSDIDGDGIPDGSDPDRDGDGYNNEKDAYPDNPKEWKDSDGDGVGNNKDAHPYDKNCWKDGDCLEPAVAGVVGDGAEAAAAATAAEGGDNATDGGIVIDPSTKHGWDPEEIDKVEKLLPPQGYDEHSRGPKVEHDDQETYTGDWRKEWPKKDETEQETITRICREQPHNVWCKRYQDHGQFRR
eukprot:TRINITY_DN25286_c0_g1_i1.p1 TRINITY_DN25286_c0_g1~~TRINITY_DN25286_c0_g1_i1.p1  ORF type:complete len:1019 (+),score=433.11 TRINITY_DN25286_c0_g1_i1:151-3207(+)